MNWFARQPLNRKLTIVMSLTAVAGLLVTFLAFGGNQYLELRSALVDEIEILADLTGTHTIAALDFEDRWVAEETLGVLRSEPQVVRACLYDGRGKLFATYFSPGSREICWPRLPGEAAAIDAGANVAVLRPVEFRGSVHGHLYLEAAPEAAFEHLVSNLGVVALVGLIAGLIALIVSGMLRNLVSSPLIALVDVVEAISQHGDYSLRAPIAGSDEIGQLASRFNDLLARIEGQDRKLRQAHEALEQHVEERTEELRKEVAVRQQTEKALAQHAAQLEEAVGDLERSNQELDDFAYIASHDLKAPLRGIHNYAGFLTEDYADALDQEGQEMLRSLGRLASNMEHLIDTLLRFSRVGRTELGMKAVPIQQTVTDVIDMLRPAFETEDVEFRVPRVMPVVTCDSARIGEVFRNLVSNALKYNDKPKRWVEIGYLDDVVRGEVRVSGPVFYVRDNGIGIRDKHMDVVFRIFKRLHGKDKFGGGTGAGLTIVKKIVERHGGEIWLESKVGEGSTFYFTLGEPTDA